MSEHDIIVIGAGISGMSFAHRCAADGRSVLVLERHPRAGGCLQTHRPPDGFWLELGAHTAYNSYQGLLGLLEARGALGEVLPREKAPFRLYADGRIRTIGQELKILELLASVPRILVTKKQHTTVRGYYGRIVGAHNYERVFGPLFAAVPSQPADDFPAEMLFKSRKRRKDIPRSFTLRGGLSTAIDALAATPNLSLTVDAEVTSLERNGAGFRVRASGGEYRARHVALAVPPPVGARLVATALPGLSEALGRLRTATAETVGVVVRRDAVSLERVAGIIPLDGSFFSAVSRDTVSDPQFRGFAFHFRSGKTLDERLAVAARVLGVDTGKLQDVVSRQVVLPSPMLGHADVVREIDSQLAGSGLFVTGNYFDGLSIEDCVSRSAREHQRLQGQVAQAA